MRRIKKRRADSLFPEAMLYGRETRPSAPNKAMQSPGTKGTSARSRLSSKTEGLNQRSPFTTRDSFIAGASSRTPERNEPRPNPDAHGSGPAAPLVSGQPSIPICVHPCPSVVSTPEVGFIHGFRDGPNPDFASTPRLTAGPRSPECPRLPRRPAMKRWMVVLSSIALFSLPVVGRRNAGGRGGSGNATESAHGRSPVPLPPTPWRNPRRGTRPRTGARPRPAHRRADAGTGGWRLVLVRRRRRPATPGAERL
jgi:hypothetical protein